MNYVRFIQDGKQQEHTVMYTLRVLWLPRWAGRTEIVGLGRVDTCHAEEICMVPRR